MKRWLVTICFRSAGRNYVKTQIDDLAELPDLLKCPPNAHDILKIEIQRQIADAPQPTRQTMLSEEDQS